MTAIAVWLLTVGAVLAVLSWLDARDRAVKARRVDRFAELRRSGVIVTPLRRRQLDALIERDGESWWDGS